MKTQTNHLLVTLVMMALLYAATTATTTTCAQVRPLPPLSFDSLSQTYVGRMAYLHEKIFVQRDELRHYVTKDEAATHITTNDARLSDARTPKGSAGGDLSGIYPNPSIKSSVYLPGSPTASTPSSSDNSTRLATTAYVQANKYTHPAYTTRAGSTGNMTPSFGGTAYTYTYNVDNSGHVTGVNTRTITIPNTTATTSSAGLMSAADKSKVDGIVPFELYNTPITISGGLPTMPNAANKAAVFSDGVAFKKGIVNDAGWIRMIGTNESDQILEIATGDDGGAGEKIVVRQYNTSNAVAREIELLNNAGNTVNKNGAFYEGSNRVYSPNNKPTPAAIGAPRILFAGAVLSPNTYTPYFGDVSASVMSSYNAWNFRVSNVNLDKCFILATSLYSTSLQVSVFKNTVIGGFSVKFSTPSGTTIKTNESSCLFSIMCLTYE